MANDPFDFTGQSVVVVGGSSGIGNGIAQAFVDYGHQSGPVAVGEKGGGAIAWLPEGWRVAAIDVQQGQLLLQAEDGRRVPYQL
jgi:3-oxoacyl-[acyl-carrier protein] reductase